MFCGQALIYGLCYHRHLKRNWSYNADVDIKVDSLIQGKRPSQLITNEKRKKKPKTATVTSRAKALVPGSKPKKSDVKLVKTNRKSHKKTDTESPKGSLVTSVKKKKKLAQIVSILNFSTQKLIVLVY